MSAQGGVVVRTQYYGQPRPTRTWLTDHLLARQDYVLFTDQEHGVPDVPGR